MPFDIEQLFPALLQQESGNRNIQGPLITAGANAGDRAQGPAQVMPKTGSSPGFGVRPIDTSLPDQEAENRRFGKDYLSALYNKFGGDNEAALIAYNAGPGNAEKWIKSGRDYSVLPKQSETEPYVKNILAMAGGKSMETTPEMYESGEPYLSKYAEQPGANKPLAGLLSQLIGERKADLAKGSSVPDATMGQKFQEALYKGGLGMLAASQRPGTSFGQALGAGLGGAGMGVKELNESIKKLQTAGTNTTQKRKDALDALRLKAAEMMGKTAQEQAKATAKANGKAGKGGFKLTDVLKLMKDQQQSGMGVEPDALREAAVSYGPQLLNDPLGRSYLQNTLVALTDKANSGEISDAERTQLIQLTKIFADSQTPAQ